MKVLMRLFTIFCLFTLLSCEEEASIADFLSDSEIDTIITGEEETQTPITIAQIQSTLFVAVKYSATINGNTTNLYFENEDRDVLTIDINGTSNITYTAGANSMNSFIGEVSYFDGPLFTTDPAVTQDSIGSLGLSINDEENTVSGNFEFTAYSPSENSFIEVIDVNFEDIPLE